VGVKPVSCTVFHSKKTYPRTNTFYMLLDIKLDEFTTNPKHGTSSDNQTKLVVCIQKSVFSVNNDWGSGGQIS
jgi:hypothetical protein